MVKGLGQNLVHLFRQYNLPVVSKIDIHAQQTASCRPAAGEEPESIFPSEIDLLTATVQQLQHHLRKGSFNSAQLVKEYLVSSNSRTIDKPDAEIDSSAMHREEQSQGP